MKHTHVYTERAAHITTGTECFCMPAVLEVCPECEAGPQRSHCWRCASNGVVLCPVPQIYDGVYGLIVVHNPEPTK